MKIAKIVPLAALVGAVMSSPAAPIRDPHSPGFVEAIELPDGTVPTADADGNFIIGTTHLPAPEMTTTALQGTVFEFTMSSADSKIYPGIVREPKTFGTPDTNDPAKLIVATSHPDPTRGAWRFMCRSNTSPQRRAVHRRRGRAGSRAVHRFG